MIDSYFTFRSTDNTNIAARKWIPDKKMGRSDQPRGIVQIVHGMAEHIGRYDEFAKKLAAQNIVTAGADLRGHGQTASDLNQLGHMTGTWEQILQDVKLFMDRLKQEYPGVPVILLGHSFGSVVARSFVQEYGDQIDGLILSGTLARRESERKAGQSLAKAGLFLFKESSKARLLHKLSFAGYNRGLDPRRSALDWLSRDRERVLDYEQDPRCGQICSFHFYHHLFEGMDRIFDQTKLVHVPKHLPVLIFSGDKDPVGKGADGSREACRMYSEAGLQNVTCTIYEGGRHEMLNETNREEVYQDIIDWLEHCFQSFRILEK